MEANAKLPINAESGLPFARRAKIQRAITTVSSAIIRYKQMNPPLPVMGG
jgi:hypothetical protein